VVKEKELTQDDVDAPQNALMLHLPFIRSYIRVCEFAKVQTH
jgi:hypothetical protein